MDRSPQSSPLGPEVGWGVGLVGFATTVAVGWVMDAGFGFVLLMLLFWGGIGALFAFLVHRSTVEEQDRVQELQGTRLATLGTSLGSRVAPAGEARATPTGRAVGTGQDEGPAAATGGSGDEGPTAGTATSGEEAIAAPTAPAPDAGEGGTLPRASTDDRPARDRAAEREERDRAAAAMLAAALEREAQRPRSRRARGERVGDASPDRDQAAA